MVQTLPGSFPCSACGASFGSRNALFRHLRNDGTACAEAEDLLEVEDQQATEEPRLPADKPNRQPKTKSKIGPRRKLQIEVRPETYLEELDAKVASMRVLLERDRRDLPLPPTEVFASPPNHFRYRASFNVRKDAAGLQYVMFEGTDRVAIQHYPMAAETICDVLMPMLLSILQDEKVLLKQLFEVSFHAAQSGDALVSLLYRTPIARAARKLKEELRQRGVEQEAADDDDPAGPLGAEWAEAAGRLHSALGSASIVGHSRGKKCVVGRDWVEEHLKPAGVDAPLRYRQLEGFFSQSNPAVAQHMLAWARAVAYADDAPVGTAVHAARDDDLLELYCGNGNFSIALAPCFRRVLATELVKALVDAANVNAEENGVTNATFARVSAEELAQGLDGSRTFQRLAHVDLKSYSLQTVVVDPPRAGLGPQMAAFIARFPRIVYISCNPESLNEDLGSLYGTHDIRRIAAFDQFPYTNHLEMGMLLVQRGR